MTNKELITELENISGNYKATGLKKAVAEMLVDQLDGYDTPEQMFEDLQHGCISGIVGDLIYYTDTHKFFATHSGDIMELFQELQENCELKIPNDTNAENWLAWLGFEETARNIGSELGIEL